VVVAGGAAALLNERGHGGEDVVHGGTPKATSADEQVISGQEKS
jgi:hypothetical protein